VPVSSPVRPTIAIRGTLAESWRLLWRQPRFVLLPMLAVQLPVAALSAAITALLYLTVFRSEEIKPTADLFSDGATAALFVYLAVSSFEALFAQVARAATIVSVAAAARDKPKTLTESLDPAFTRMGHIILLVVLLVLCLAGALVAVSILALIPFVGAAIALAVVSYVALRTMLSFETLMLEGLRPWQAIRRSWAITRGRTLRLLGLVIMAFLCIALPLVALSSLNYLITGGRTVEVIVTAAVTFVGGVLAVPPLAFISTVTTLYYLKATEMDDVRTAPRN
jgi:membrane-anchored glycerophosphoryl diester phosphodiesterase (GDPDase)